MRKFYSLFTFAVMMFASLTANAQTMTEENPILDQMGYRLEKDVNFYAGTVNGKDIVPNDAFLFTGETESFQVNKYYPQKLGNEGLEFMSIQLGNDNMSFAAGTGIKSTKNERWLIINNLRVGQILSFDISREDTTAFVVNSIACNSGTGWADTPSDPLIVEPISGSIHELQELAEEGSADKFRYFKVINEGPLCCKFNGKSANVMYRMQIWADKNDAEAVTVPIMKMYAVNGTSRGIDFKPGESTFDKPCTSYYITEEDVENGVEYPIWLKETEDVDHYEYTYQLDEEGNPVLDEEGNPVKLDSTAVYKKVLDYDMAAEVGQFGEHPYDPEIGLWIDQNSDVNGDGLVTIWACTLSEETGVYSNIVSLDVSVGEIVLNQPTLSLVGMSGVDRVYKINWTANTLCGEPYTIVVEGTGEDSGYAEEFPESTGNGAVISFKEHVNVTVSAPGYSNSTLEYDADMAGIKISRVNENPESHDWDFVNISQDMYNQFTGNVVASYLEVVDNDTIARTIAEYEAQEEAGVDVSGWITVPAVYGWYQPIASNRTTLNVVEGGLDMNANGYGYVEEKTGIFHDLAISCPPNASNNSCIFKYIDKTDGNELGALGVYFMSRPTITFPRSVAKAGQFVEIYYGQGGSNYTNTTTHQFYEVPADGLLSVTLPSGGVHVFYIDVHTYDNLPEDLLENAEQAWEDVVVIDNVKASKKVSTYYTLSGAKLAAPQKGINIVKYADGTSMKILVK